MKDTLMQEIPFTEPDDLDILRTFTESVKDLQTPNDNLAEAIQLEIDKLTVNKVDENKPLTREEIDEMMKVLATGKPIITEKILEIIQRLVKLPGITTLHYRMVGHDRKPFRGKMICYAIRSADGDEVTLPKILRRPYGPRTVVRPLTERRNLFTLSDNFARGPQDPRWSNVVTRFSAAYTILKQLVEGMQSEKILRPEDATEQRINSILHREGDSETGEATTVSPGTETTPMEDTQDQEPIAG